MAIAPASAWANAPGGGSTGADVTLGYGSGVATLANGIVTVKVNTTLGKITSFVYQGKQFVSQGTSGHVLTYYSIVAGSGTELIPSRCVYSVTTQTTDMADISCRQTYDSSKDPVALDFDLHFVLRRGNTGIYSYSVLHHPASYPASSSGEWRMVWWMPTDPANTNNYLLENIYVDDLRHWTMASAYDETKAITQGIAEIELYTTGIRKGLYNCKYEFSAEYYTTKCWGFASDVNQAGLWCVLGSEEYFNDGPKKQDLIVASSIIQIYLNQDHYNGSGVTVNAGEKWDKIYGPFLFYANDKSTGDLCWADAQAQAAAEESAWPYAWVADPTYQATTRGAVSGKLIVNDPLKADVSGANSWIGLAQSDDPTSYATNWQFQGKDYQYWAKTDAAGNFVIPHVRPGTYALYTFVDGVVGEHKVDNVTVTANATTALGDLTWSINHPGLCLAWEIGKADRDSTEFAHGSTDYFEPYHYTTFNDYYTTRTTNEGFPNPIVYDTANKDWSTKLNYAQNSYGGAGVGWPWDIHFNLVKVPSSGNATLTIAWAGNDHGHYYIYVNSTSSISFNGYPPIGGGNGLLREGSHAKYCYSTFSIPVSKLHVGDNTIRLLQASTSGAGNHFMYDYLSLEMPNADAMLAAPTVFSDWATTTTRTPAWTWASGGGGNGMFRYRLDETTDDWTTTTATAWTPSSALANGTHVLDVQESDSAGDWSASGSFAVMVDTTLPSAPKVFVTAKAFDKRPTWGWFSSGGGGDGTFRYQFDETTGDWTTTTATTWTPASDLTAGQHVLYVQERDALGAWSASGSAMTFDTLDILNADGSWRRYD
jgi:hypothetical protein